MAQEAFQERELPRAEVHRLVVDGDAPGGLVERDGPGRELGLRAPVAIGFRAAPCERPQAGGQLLEGEGLHEVVVRAGVETGDPVPDGVARGEHEDRHVRALLAQTACDLEPADVGQSDVEDDALDAGCVLRDLEPGLAVGGQFDDVPVVLEQPLEQPRETRIVLDDEEVHDVSAYLPASPTARP